MILFWKKITAQSLLMPSKRELISWRKSCILLLEALLDLFMIYYCRLLQFISWWRKNMLWIEPLTWIKLITMHASRHSIWYFQKWKKNTKYCVQYLLFFCYWKQNSNTMCYNCTLETWKSENLKTPQGSEPLCFQWDSRVLTLPPGY